MAQQASRKPVFPPEIAPYIDVAAYLIDARAPAATLYLDAMLTGKELMLLTRSDQADKRHTRLWLAFLKRSGYPVLSIDSLTGEGIPKVLDYLARLHQLKLTHAKRRGIGSATLRMVALGVPNVGKSTFLNTLLGERHFKTGDRPGITRGRQWVRLFQDVEVLDTAGVLRDPAAINRRKPYWLLLNLMPYDFRLRDSALELLLERLDEKSLARLWKFYKQEGKPVKPAEPMELMQLAAKRFGFGIHNDDTADRAARRVLRDFREGRFGRISLETAGEAVISSPIFRFPTDAEQSAL
jgi:ribosome biogenesis GTPase A